jgi:hypothetical protein
VSIKWFRALCHNTAPLNYLHSPLLYEVQALTHPLHAAPAAAADVTSEHRTKGADGHAVTGEFEAEDEGAEVLAGLATIARHVIGCHLTQ